MASGRGAQTSSRTLKIAQIPGDFESEAFVDVFEDFGPTTKCFIVRKKASQPDPEAQLFGFVQFVLAEDAIQCARGSLPRGMSAMSVPDRDEAGAGPQVKRQEFEKLEEDRRLAHQKKARLIVRNISFKTRETDLETHFGQFGGQIAEVKILRKPDGKMVGCAFVQMGNVAEAAQVIKKLNGQPLLDRPIAVDWAVDKRSFQEQNGGRPAAPVQAEVKEEPDCWEDEGGAEDSEVEFKPEMDDDDIQEEDESDAEADGSESEGGSESDLDEDRGDKPWHGLTTGHDISENKTVFLRNLSFDSDEDSLREMMETQFGPLLFAKLVMDKLTEHPKGTAFVKFQNPDHAETLLETSDTPDGVHLDGRRIFAVKALAKTDADQVQKDKKEKEKKDTRNLHLAVEGLIRKGTRAAQGVSEADMTKRAQMARWKRGMLKDLNMFVSPFRLCVRNLPQDLTDLKLKKLFVKHSRPAAVLTEAKIIRDMTKVNSKGLGKSKEYGFVTFKEHEDALNALRKLNNNPESFHKDGRPIVEFSIENRKAVNAREKRLQRSRENNPNYQKRIAANQPTEIQGNFKRKEKKEFVEDKDNFVGSINDPKQRNLPSHTGEKIRHNRKPNPTISRKAIKKMEQEKKNPKKRKMNQNPPAAEPVEEPQVKKTKTEKKQKNKKGKGKKTIDAQEEKQFDSLVNKYRAKLNTATSNIETKKKWFE